MHRNVFGSWESYCEYDGDSEIEYEIWGYDVEYFEFNIDYSGCYYFYSEMGLSYIDFRWTTYGNRLVIWDIYGNNESLYYTFDNGDLILSTTSDFYNYIVYCPTGFYYEQGKSIDLAKAKSFDPTTEERPQPATMKAKVE